MNGGVASSFGPKEIGATLSGQGMIAVLVSSVQVASSVLVRDRSGKGEGGLMKVSTLWFISGGTLLLFGAISLQ